MTKFKNPIPAILIHTEGCDEYRIGGKILAINESNNTVSMKINGRAGVEHNIPMDAIYLTEGILDSIKNAGKAIMKGINYLVRKIKGFLLPVDENGNVNYACANAPINLAALDARGELPEGVRFYPNDTIKEAAEENGVAVNDEEEIELDSSDDAETVEAYWAQVMKTYVANESYTAQDAVKAVNERYMQRMNKGKLNEAIASLNNPNYNKNMYGVERSSSEIIAECVKNIKAQLRRGIGAGHTVPPMLIWGAPGIGKTMILSGICKQLKASRGLDLMFEVVQCSSLNSEDWGIPAINAIEEFGDASGQYNKNIHSRVATSIPKSWLPVYEMTEDDTQNEIMDNYFNTGAFRTAQNEYSGGLLMFDELSRLPDRSKNVMMALVDQYMYENYHMASKWCLIFASNRYEDVRYGDESDFIWEMAQSDRFTHVTFVPEREEWLEWARQTNKVTGLQNIDEKYCAFIEQSSKGVWYDALAFGSRKLSQEDQQAINNYSDPDAVRAVLDDNPSLKGHLGWTPRSWEGKVVENERTTLRDIFEDHPELFKSIFKDGNLDNVALEQALNMLSPAEWNEFADPYRKKLDPQGRMSRIAFYDAYVQEYIITGSFGEGELPSTEWSIYNEYKKTFTPDVCTSIWKTGKMPAGKLMQDDDKFFTSAGSYATTETSKWKGNAELVKNVIEILMTNYPGGIENAAKQIIAEDQFDNAAPLTPAEAQKLFAKFMQMYTITVGKDKIPTLFKGNENPTTPTVMDVLKSLENSEFARNLANVASYIVKIAIQRKDNSVLVKDGAAWLYGISGRFYELVKSANPKAFKQLMHIDDMKSLTNDDKARHAVICKTLMAPAMFILSHGENRDKNYAKTGKY